MTTWAQLVSLVALVLALAALVVGLLVLRTLRRRTTGNRRAREPAGTDRPAAHTGPAAFVVNPIKVADIDALRSRVCQSAEELGLAEPLWYTTTPQDPGAGQAKAALAAGASTVVAAGGDGTVREVASALAGTRVPMALLPLGTGNLLARNLDLPLESVDSLIHTALGGSDYPLDLGWLRPEHVGPHGGVARDDPGGSREPGEAQVSTDSGEARAPGEDGHLFLVMAGIGFDVQMVAGARDELKARMGWLAYFFAGVRHLHGHKTRLRMQVGEGEIHRLKVRSLLFANCGRLPGGIVLLPDAQLDDGWLDVAALDTRGGLIGWASLFGKVMLQGIGVRPALPAPSSIHFWRGRRVRVVCDQPEQLQVDGDLIDPVRAMTVWVQPSGLLVRAR